MGRREVYYSGDFIPDKVRRLVLVAFLHQKVTLQGPPGDGQNGDGQIDQAGLAADAAPELDGVGRHVVFRAALFVLAVRGGKEPLGP